MAIESRGKNREENREENRNVYEAFNSVNMSRDVIDSHSGLRFIRFVIALAEQLSIKIDREKDCVAHEIVVGVISARQHNENRH